jgi:hypothetical protein
MGLIWLISLIAASNFSTILLMKREGIPVLKSAGDGYARNTMLICVLVVPVVTFVTVSAIMHVVMLYD